MYKEFLSVPDHVWEELSDVLREGEAELIQSYHAKGNRFFMLEYDCGVLNHKYNLPGFCVVISPYTGLMWFSPIEPEFPTTKIDPIRWHCPVKMVVWDLYLWKHHLKTSQYPTCPPPIWRAPPTKTPLSLKQKLRSLISSRSRK